MFTFISLRLKKELSLISSDLPLEKRGLIHIHNGYLYLINKLEDIVVFLIGKVFNSNNVPSFFLNETCALRKSVKRNLI